MSRRRRDNDATERLTEDGYVLVRCPDGHGLAGDRADGWVREHRLVLFDRIGPGEHPCHWCDLLVSWDVSYKPGGSVAERWGALIADHLDGDRQNNDPDNVVGSCPWCNSNRGGMQKLGLTFDDVRGVDPEERPKCGALPALTHGQRKARRRFRRGPVLETVDAPEPVIPDPGPEEDARQAEVAARRYGDGHPAAVPPAARRRLRPLWWGRWVVGVAVAYVWSRWGQTAGLAALVLWFGWVGPVVRVRRRRARVAPFQRAWVSWKDIDLELDGKPPAVRVPVERAEPPPPRPSRPASEEPPSPVDFEPVVDDEDDQVLVAGDEDPEGGEDLEPVGAPAPSNVLPFRSPETGRPVGLPPPPPKRR